MWRLVRGFCGADVRIFINNAIFLLRRYTRGGRVMHSRCRRRRRRVLRVNREKLLAGKITEAREIKKKHRYEGGDWWGSL